MLLPRIATTDGMTDSRIETARRRASYAKSGLGLAAGITFVVGLALVRGTVTSHAKARPQPLAAPDSFTRALRQASIAPGAIAPPQAPPQTSTAVS
ncbi:MAG: hypothetical protein QOJ31_174 [Gaiellales bacterium]|nr:hypothetical protein [Gaiellales bacterium]MDX6545212.1 hypothetical protein [Gaiellales bacterium]MDX6549490.1 hypothetical protein [Gaiellales bacterium]